MSEAGACAGRRGMGPPRPPGSSRCARPCRGSYCGSTSRKVRRVEEGQGLLIVEAMKMENELRARAAGRVRRVHRRSRGIRQARRRPDRVRAETRATVAPGTAAAPIPRSTLARFRQTMSGGSRETDDPRSATDSGIPVRTGVWPRFVGSRAPRRSRPKPGEFPVYARHPPHHVPRLVPGRCASMPASAPRPETNRRYRYLLESGTTGLSVAFDLPTQMGYDSDHPMAAGEVGRVGVAIDSIEDMRLLFERIPLEDVSTSMTINSTAAILLALYVGLADEQGVPRARLAGTVQNDILKEYIARGTYIYPAEPSLRLVSDVIAFCSRELPQVESGVDLRLPHPRSRFDRPPGGRLHLRQRARVRAPRPRIRELRSRISPRAFPSFSPRTVIVLEEVAKFRAARRLWARLMRRAVRGLRPERAAALPHPDGRVDADRSAAPQQRDPHHSAGARGGAGGDAVSAHQRIRRGARAPHRGVGPRIALRAQQILLRESGVARTVDPLGGKLFR